MFFCNYYYIGIVVIAVLSTNVLIYSIIFVILHIICHISGIIALRCWHGLCKSYKTNRFLIVFIVVERKIIYYNNKTIRYNFVLEI